MTRARERISALLTILIALSSCEGGGDNTKPPDPPPASIGNWTWMSGSNGINQEGAYGTLGVADPSNHPGARKWAASWPDSGGRLWLFGGVGYDSAGHSSWLNDLWKYDPTTLEWTWVSGTRYWDGPGVYGVKGLADPSNVPGARMGAASWLDSSGNFWLFGGSGYDSAGYSDLLNDLWKYDPEANEWTWISGSHIGEQVGVYGTKGVADSSNVPGARSGAVSWIDASGSFWLFGGEGIFSVDTTGNWFNDLWKFDQTTQKWAWMSGSNAANPRGTYGTQGKTDPSNAPGARSGAVSWIDSSGKFWLFGGEGSILAGGYLNDLWQYTR